MSLSDTAISIIYGLGLLLAIIYLTWLVDAMLSRRAFSKGNRINPAIVAIVMAFLFLGVAFSAKVLPIRVQAQIINISLFPEVYRTWIKEDLSQRDSAVLLRFCSGSVAQLSLADVLSRQGERAAKPLLEALQSNDAATRACARHALSQPRMSEDVYNALPELSDALEKATPAIQVDILAVIGTLGPRGRKAVPALIRLLEEEGEVQVKAIDALGAIGPGAKEAAPKLIALFNNAEKESERAPLAVAITLIGPHDEAARPAVLYALQKRGFKNEVNARGNRWLRDMK